MTAAVPTAAAAPPPRLLIPPTLSTLAEPAGFGARIGILSGATMGTRWTVKLLLPAATEPEVFRAGIQQRLDRVVAQMSSRDRGSDLRRYNRAPAGHRQTLAPGAVGGAGDCGAQRWRLRDPTAGAPVELWCFGASPARIAPRRTLMRSRRRGSAADGRCCLWDRAASALMQPGGIALDLYGIAKGYGVDCVFEYLQGCGLQHVLVEVGGELRGCGCKPDGRPWWVAQERPPGAESLAQTRVALHAQAIATSGDYLRYFEAAGRRYSHTLDPRTALPVDGRVAAVTVLHRSCMYADAWATAPTVLGAEAGLALAKAQGLAAAFVCAAARPVAARPSAAPMRRCWNERRERRAARIRMEPRAGTCRRRYLINHRARP